MARVLKSAESKVKTVKFTEIKVQTLPSMPLSKRREFPACPAIYLVVGEDQKVLYIGRTVNLRQRWKTHHKYSAFSGINGVRLAWLEVTDLYLLPPIEEGLIKHFKPPHNTSRIAQEVHTRFKCNLNGLMVKKGVTLATLSKETGIHHTTLSALANNTSLGIDWDTFSTLYQYFNCQSDRELIEFEKIGIDLDRYVQKVLNGYQTDYRRKA